MPAVLRRKRRRQQQSNNQHPAHPPSPMGARLSYGQMLSSRLHSGGAPCFNSAGQLTTTSSGCDPPVGACTRNRFPSGATA